MRLRDAHVLAAALQPGGFLSEDGVASTDMVVFEHVPDLLPALRGLALTAITPQTESRDRTAMREMEEANETLTDENRRLRSALAQVFEKLKQCETGLHA